MADNKTIKAPKIQNNIWKAGQFHLLDSLKAGDDAIGSAISAFGDYTNTNRSSRHWVRSVSWMENILFSNGRHYVDDLLVSRISSSSSGDLSTTQEASRNIPRPVNDLLGRYIETNIALLTENRPRPRVSPKSNKAEDEDAAELSELTLEYLWEALKMPELHREMARIILHCGICFMEIAWDPLIPRRVTVPQTRTETTSIVQGPDGQPLQVPVPRQVPILNAQGQAQTQPKVEYGDLSVRVISPFEMHLPIVHWWDEIAWTMREWYTPKDVLVDKFSPGKIAMKLNKKDGWHLDRLDDVGTTNVKDLPLWWWERLSDLVEGPGRSLYVGAPDQWEGYTTCKWFDRKPNPRWPKGRSILVCGDKVIYDSPKDKGSRVYDDRWPHRWHPYVRFRWEPQLGSIYGRSMVSKLLPKLKRVNAIDTTLIMWRRTVPISTWIIPKGCAVSDMLVITSTGEAKEIQDININDYVQTNIGVRKVTNKFEYDNDESVYSIKAKGYLPILMTGNHIVPVLTKEVYNEKVKRRPSKYDYSLISESDVIEKKFKDIQIGDYLLSGFTRSKGAEDKIDLSKYIKKYKFIRNAIPQYIKIDKNFLKLLGLYLAEGSFGNKCSVKWTIGLHEKDTLGNEIRILVKNVFGLDVRYEESYKNGSRLQIWLHSSPIKDLFEALCGRGAKNKKIAPEIFNCPKSLLPLVGGWIQGNGCSQSIPRTKDGRTRTWKQSSASTISKNLAFQICSILLDEKIPSSIFETKNDRNNTKYVLTWDTQSRRSLASYCDKFKEDTAQKTARQGFWIDNLYATRVKNIEEVDYTGKVYDLEIEENHYYQVNGIIVHNSQPVDDLWSGRPGGVWTYDPNRTRGNKPEPVFAPDYPKTALEERATQISEMEFIAGTEEVLRGQRPIGTNSAAMIDILRKQALASRSAILQSWDESIQEEGSSILQEIVKNVRKDSRYAERIRILARENMSRLAIENFSGTDLSDNVIVKVDTVSMALVSKEAKEAKAIEFMQYAPGLMTLPLPLRQAIIERLGFEKALKPQGADIDRAKRMLSYIRQEEYGRVIPFPEDDPYVFLELLTQELKSEAFWDYNEEQQGLIIGLVDTYKKQVQFREEQALKMQQLMQGVGGNGAAPPQQDEVQQ